jgi:hypothetical protein
VLLEIAKPVALVLCMLSLCSVFYTAFLAPASDLEQRIWDSLSLLSLAAGICLSSGLIFREESHAAGEVRHAGGGLRHAGGGPSRAARDPLLRTLPVQMFCWGAGLIVVLFAASWYLETYCVFYRDVRRF